MRGVDLFQCGTFELDGTDCDVTVERLLQGNSRITVEGKGVGYHRDDNIQYNCLIYRSDLMYRSFTLTGDRGVLSLGSRQETAELCPLAPDRRLRSSVPWLLTGD